MELKGRDAISGLPRILEIDSRKRKVKIEPGVTWHQLQEALKEHDQMPQGCKEGVSCIRPELLSPFHQSSPVVSSGPVHRSSHRRGDVIPSSTLSRCPFFVITAFRLTGWTFEAS